MNNYYEILGLKSITSLDKIEDAYRGIISNLSGEESVEYLSDLNKAYTVLSNKKLRDEYDKEYSKFLKKLVQNESNNVKTKSRFNYLEKFKDQFKFKSDKGYNSELILLLVLGIGLGLFYLYKSYQSKENEDVAQKYTFEHFENFTFLPCDYKIIDQANDFFASTSLSGRYNGDSLFITLCKMEDVLKTLYVNILEYQNTGMNHEYMRGLLFTRVNQSIKSVELILADSLYRESYKVFSAYDVKYRYNILSHSYKVLDLCSYMLDKYLEDKRFPNKLVLLETIMLLDDLKCNEIDRQTYSIYSERLFTRLSKDLRKEKFGEIGVRIVEVDTIMEINQNMENIIGLKVLNYIEGSPANYAEVKDNDIIIKINNERVSTIYDITNFTKSHNLFAGDIADLLIIRDNKEIVVSVTLN